ncbi:MAG: hypothetical protein EBT26_09125, partial [Microbacteriaceae bacterium]|nr:hypothetical protein [Microbacteriaceae bacterium]
MAAGTALNESLACVALGYIANEENHSLDGFHTLITKTTGVGGLWGKVIARCELSDRTVLKYRDAYKDVGNQPNPWIYTSYQSAVEIEKKLNLQGKLKDYKFSKVERNVNYDAYWLKQKATSGIKKYAKEILKNKAGILATLNADKVNIGDIFLIKKNSKQFDNIKKLIEDTDVSASILKKNILDKKELLTAELYRDLMIEAWKDREIFSVSLKALDAKQENVPVKVYNLPTSLSRTISERQQDEFALYLTYLIGISKKSGNTFGEFKKAIDSFVQIKPVVFTAADRLLVYFDLVYDKKEKKHYHIFTNFGSGNAIHFVPAGSKSASGEGGITINYFHTLTKNFPELKVFFQELKDARLHFFDEACKEYGVNSKTIMEKLGSQSMTSGVYDSSLYLAKHYGDLIDEMLGEKNIFRIGQVVRRGNDYYAKINDKMEKMDEDGNVILNAKGKPVMIHVTEEKKILNPTNLSVLQKFFDNYTAYLSKQKGSMGKFLGASEKAKTDMNKKITSVRNDIEKLAKKEKDPKKKEQARKQAIKDVLHKTQFAKPTYKKSYALLTNAEFGFFFAKHQTHIEEVLKKQVLLSFYSAASGRGYVIFDGKRFSEDDIFEKNVAPPPFLKV